MPRRCRVQLRQQLKRTDTVTNLTRIYLSTAHLWRTYLARVSPRRMLVLWHAPRIVAASSSMDVADDYKTKCLAAVARLLAREPSFAL